MAMGSPMFSQVISTVPAHQIAELDDVTNGIRQVRRRGADQVLLIRSPGSREYRWSSIQSGGIPQALSTVTVLPTATLLEEWNAPTEYDSGGHNPDRFVATFITSAINIALPLIQSEFRVSAVTLG